MQEAISHYRTLEDNHFLAIWFYHLAECQLETGDAISAHESITESQSVSHHLNQPSGRSEMHRIRANIYSALEKNHDTVVAEYRESRKIAQRQQARLFQLRTLLDECSFKRKHALPAPEIELLAQSIGRFGNETRCDEVIAANKLLTEELEI